MTRIFDSENGKATAVTVVMCEPNTITQVKTEEKDGYNAVVLGDKKRKKETKTKKFQNLKEFKVNAEEVENYKKGEQISVEAFQEVSKVTVSSNCKGRGFQGVIKRHNFSRGPETHGSHHHREPGSIGACTKPGRVAKGKKMPGRMKARKVTLKGVKVALVDPAKNIICVKGAVPGPNGAVVSLTIAN